jgi:hypothetical protein
MLHSSTGYRYWVLITLDKEGNDFAGGAVISHFHGFLAVIGGNLWSGLRNLHIR